MERLLADEPLFLAVAIHASRLEGRRRDRCLGRVLCVFAAMPSVELCRKTRPHSILRRLSGPDLIADIKNVPSYERVSKTNLRTIWATVVAFAALGACVNATPSREEFVALDDQGAVIATVTLQQPLPPHDTSFTFTGPSAYASGTAGTVQPMTFEVAGAFQCHWSTLIVICQTGERNPAPAETAEGRDVRRLDADTILVASRPGSLAGDFATFRNGRLVAFGVRDETGKEPWRYDLR